MDEAGEVNGASVVAGGETAEMLEADEAPLNLVAMLVDAGVVRMATLRLRFDGITAVAFMPAILVRKSLPS